MSETPDQKPKRRVIEFESTPRWPGAPQICQQTNLPAFKTVSDLEAFHKTAPACHELHRWQCSFCGCWHSWGVAPDPAGGSSGTGRHMKVDWDEEAVQKLMRRLYGDNYMETPLVDWK